MYRNGDADAVREFPIREIHGISQIDTCRTLLTSAGCRWQSTYVSMQIEDPYERSFPSSPHLFIGLVRSGSARLAYSLNAGEISSNLHSGQVGILAPAQSVRFRLNRRLHTTHLYLHASLLAEVAADIFNRDPASIEVITKLPFIDPLLEGLVGAIGEAAELNPETPDLHVEHLARTLAGHVLQHHSSAGPFRAADEPAHGLTRRQMARFQDVVEARMGHKLSLADLAEGSGLTAGHFTRLFKLSTGKTPYQYLLHSRVRRARYLLAKTSLPILQIASECGFADHVHFTRVFSRTVGRPPAAFRKLAND
ncbi:helix-turn-helix transcriptional regulator [Aquamicrobium sp. LC103]|nr:helix-turn-helix transcriptional regulator [Aquamicrobium sp. LC103]